MSIIGFESGEEYIAVPFYFEINDAIISGTIFLQILTKQASSAIFIESRIIVSESIDKEISELSMRIILLFCCFIEPHAIIYV